MGFEPTISAGERPHIYALERAATGIGGNKPLGSIKCRGFFSNSLEISVYQEGLLPWRSLSRSPVTVAKSNITDCEKQAKELDIEDTVNKRFRNADI